MIEFSIIGAKIDTNIYFVPLPRKGTYNNNKEQFLHQSCLKIKWQASCLQFAIDDDVKLTLFAHYLSCQGLKWYNQQQQ